jgi:hypothetical protein
LVEALQKKTLLPNIQVNAINSLMALNQVNETFHGYTMMFNNFEGRSMVDANDVVLCNRFFNSLVNITKRTHDMPHRAKSVTPLSTTELHNILKRLVVNLPHMGRAEQSQDDTAGNGDGHGSNKRPRNNGVNDNGNGGKKPRPDKL